MKPQTIEEAAELLKGLRAPVVFRGGGTQLGASEGAAFFDTAGLNRIVQYAPSDQVVTAEAGVTLAALQAELATHRQRLSLDAPWPGRATLGGIVAANSFGPLRTRFGSVRDLIIGVSIIRADGTQAKGGGKVVKTVAGFDLPKLMVGSRGTLGLLATCTFRVHPLPESAATLVLRGAPAPAVFALVKAMRAAQLEPTAMVAHRAAAQFDIAVRFEGFESGVKQQSQKLRALGAFELSDDSVWAAHEALRTSGAVRLKVAALPSQLEQVSSALPGAFRLSWYPTLGLGFALADGAPDLAQPRAAVAALNGYLTVESGGPAFGAPPASLRLHQQLKARFDPQNVLSPGHFIGGI